MADERALLRERERAVQARVLLDHPLWREAWETWEAATLKEWRGTQSGETQRREQLWAALDAGAKVRRHIERIVETGRMAEQALADAQRREDR